MIKSFKKKKKMKQVWLGKTQQLGSFSFLFRLGSYFSK